MEVALLLTIYPIPFRIIFVRTSCINNIVFRDDFFKFGKGIGKRMVLIVVSVEKKKMERDSKNRGNWSVIFRGHQFS